MDYSARPQEAQAETAGCAATASDVLAEALCPATDEHKHRVYVEAMMLMREIREVQAVGRWLRNPHVLAQEQADTKAAKQIAECREWHNGALAHEKVHGRGSLLDREHPFWIDHLEPARHRAKQILADEGGGLIDVGQ